MLNFKEVHDYPQKAFCENFSHGDCPEFPCKDSLEITAAQIGPVPSLKTKGSSKP